MPKWWFYFLKMAFLLVSAELGFTAEEVPPQLAKPAAAPKPLHKPALLNQAPQQASIAVLLNWVCDLNPNNLCKGSFVETPLQFPVNLPKHSMSITADSANFDEAGSVIYTDKVTVTQINQKITADKAVTRMKKNRRGIKTIQADGNVSIQQPGILTVAPHVKLNLAEKTAVFYKPIYRLLCEQDTLPGLTLPAHGSAKIAKQVAPQQYALVDATYTTCSPFNKDWNLHAKNVHIDQTKRRITAKHVYFTAAGIPIAYTPYINFSYDKTPKSGFLAPILNYDTRFGSQLGVPFYWYSAPNAIAVITPTHFSQRGQSIEIDFQYLTWRSLGQFYFNLLPFDQTFAAFKKTAGATVPNPLGLVRLQHAATARSYFSWRNQTLLNPYWKSLSNFNYVSDDYYFRDVGGNTDQTSVNQLKQHTSLHYNGKNWTFLGSIENYQTLHPVNDSTSFIDRYARWPQLQLGFDYPNNWGGFTYKAHFNYTHFRQPIFTNYVPSNITSVVGLPIMGQRIHLQPEIGLRFYQLWGYFKPQIQLNQRLYRLSNLDTEHAQQHINHTIPIFNIDSGLYFYRNTSINKQHYMQTLEPRFFYLRVPTINQKHIPVFDTSEASFTYDSIFQTNRFTGIDRVSNAHQLGIGLTTHLINKQTGFTRLTAKLGEIFYFEDRKVPLSTLSVNDTKTFSPIAAELTYAISNALSLNGNGAWNPNYGFIQNGALTISYKPDEKRLLNFGVNYQRVDIMNPGVGPYNKDNNIKQILASGHWPISAKLSTLSALTYNLNNKYAQTYLVGLEYNTCCWALRVVAARNYLFMNTQHRPMYHSSYYLQFILKGLTSLGNNDNGKLLANNIPGYTSALKD